MTPLQIACINDSEKVAEILINHIDIDKLVTTCFPLHFICKSKNENVNLINLTLVRFQQQQTARNQAKSYLDLALNKMDLNKQTVLHIAAENNHLNIVDVLLGKFNANGSLKDGKNGNLCIHLAAKTGSLKMLDILKKHNV